MTYDAQRAADFFDDYGEREWHRFARRGDRVLDIGTGPGDCGEHLLAVLRKP